jgi:hypothetical protein
MNRRQLLVIAGWLATALVATVAGVALIGRLGESLSGPSGDVLSAGQVRQALATITTASPAYATPPAAPSTTRPAPDATVTPGPSSRTKLITTRGGVVMASCHGDQVTLHSWSPAQGYEVDDVDPGPDDEAEVIFESDDSETEIKVHCTPAGPAPAIRSSD